jgi:hypothetical protein
MSSNGKLYGEGCQALAADDSRMAGEEFARFKGAGTDATNRTESGNVKHVASE